MPIARIETPRGRLLVQRQAVNDGDEFMVTITGPDIRIELMQRQARSLAGALRVMIGEPVDLFELAADPDFSLLNFSGGDEDLVDDDE